MQLLEMKWTEVSKLSRDLPIVIPIAALEQHGPHMPVFTDSLLLGEVAGTGALCAFVLAGQFASSFGFSRYGFGITTRLFGRVD
jgi:creatinine amidohydrolase/Fe(II)-dependent formamide hydrolase-like protein